MNQGGPWFIHQKLADTILASDVLLIIIFTSDVVRQENTRTRPGDFATLLTQFLYK